MELRISYVSVRLHLPQILMEVCLHAHHRGPHPHLLYPRQKQGAAPCLTQHSGEKGGAHADSQCTEPSVCTMHRLLGTKKN